MELLQLERILQVPWQPILQPVRAAVVEEPGEDLPLRSVRLFIDPASEEVIGVRLHRHSSNLLFGETSQLELMLAPFPDGRWLPKRTDYRVALRAALTATRRFHLERTYEVPAEGWTMLKEWRIEGVRE
jgi:hypothetical protein